MSLINTVGQPIEMKPLRVCGVCGFEAHTEEDLDLFVKHEECLHGRRNICKRCHGKASKERIHRTAEFCKIFRARSPDGMRCHFCRKEVTVLEGHQRESLVIHSIDGDHENWDPQNKVPTHYGCHTTHHHTGKWVGERSPK